MNRLYKWYKSVAVFNIIALIILSVLTIIYCCSTFSITDPDYIEKAIEYPNLYPIEEAPIITNKFAILACCTVALYIVFSAITLYLILTKKKTVVIESTDTPKNRTDEIKLLESFVSNSIQAENRSNWYKEDAYKANMNIPAGVLLLKNNNPQSEALVTVYSDSKKTKMLFSTKFKNTHYITLLNNQFLKVINADCVQRVHVVCNYDPTNLGDGMYRIGTDIPAGTYRLNSKSYASYTIYSDASSERITICALKFSGGTVVSVVNGYYIMLENCSAEFQS